MAPRAYLYTKKVEKGSSKGGRDGGGGHNKEEATLVVMEVRNVTLPRVGQCRR